MKQRKPFLDHVQPPHVVAHRGASWELPGNSMEAFFRANELAPGCLLELDVWPTGDGVVMVFHDDLLDHATNGQGPLPDYTFGELQNIDAGYGFRDARGEYSCRGKGFRITTLEAVFRAFPHNPVSIDLKYDSLSFVQVVMDLILRENAQDRVVIGSFYGRVMKRVRSAFPFIATACTAGEVMRFLAAVKTGIGILGHVTGDVFMVPEYSSSRFPEYLGPGHRQGIRVVTPSFIQRAHNQGMPVMVWTVNRPENMERLISWGVDGIVSDNVAVLADMVHRLS